MKPSLITAALAFALALTGTADASGRGSHGSSGSHYSGSHYSGSSYGRYSGSYSSYSRPSSGYRYSSSFRFGYGRDGRYGYNTRLRRDFDHKGYHSKHGVRFSHGFYYSGRHHNHWTWSYYSRSYKARFFYSPGARSWYYWHGPSRRYYPTSYISMAAPTPDDGAPPAAEGEAPPLPEGAGSPPPPPADAE